MQKYSLVTGGAGFIGSHVARHCLELGHKVLVLDDLSGGCRENVPGEASFVQGSVEDTKLVNQLFQEHRFNYVYHLAAYAAEGLSHFIRHFNYSNNLLGSINLINASILNDIECFVFTSSIAVYGSNQLPMTEDLPPSPEDPYGISKLAVELDLRAAHEMFGLPYIIFRPHNVYGEHQNLGDTYRNVVGIFMNQIMQQKPLTIFGDGMQTRAFSYIDDVAPHIARSVTVPQARNEVFNIGADSPFAVKELAEVVAGALGCRPQLSFLPARNEVQHAYANHEKAARVFGLQSPVPLTEGVRRMAAWARRVGVSSGTQFQNIEVRKGLPPSWAAFTD